MSHTQLLGIVLTLAFVPFTAAADEESDAREIIQRAIKALGGEEEIVKFSSMTWKSRGVYHTANGDTPYSATYAVQWPDKFRFEMEGRFTMVVNGDRGWIILGGNPNEIPPEQLVEQKHTVYAGVVSRLVSLKDKEYTLTTAAESKVLDRPAIAVRVSRKERPDVTLYFDKESHLLVKRERRAKPIDLGGMEVTIEDFYSDYKEVDGFKFAGRVDTKRDGKPLVDAEMFDAKAADKLDAKLFEKD
ncbi:MAG: hypothetical protein HY000_32990 [Planctomycetes bacterium]|nr:hypothetical protein [Planctomycetota bacterium]